MFDTYYTPKELERKHHRDALLKKDVSTMTNAELDELAHILKEYEDDRRLNGRILFGFIIAIGLAAAYPLQAIIAFPVFLVIFLVIFILAFFSVF